MIKVINESSDIKMQAAPKMQVKCGVENCHYNNSRMCHAENLEVNAMGDKKAETSDGTACSTFKKHEAK
jgi:hypothetical protein